MATPGPSTPTTNVGIFPTEGVDFSAIYYINTNSIGGANYAPETPAPPFALGTHAFGQNESEYVFCQLNTGTIVPWAACYIDNFSGISVLNTGTPYSNKYQFAINATGNTVTFYGFANTSLAKQTAPIQAFFWAAVRGNNLAILTSATATAFARTYGQIAGTTSPGRITSVNIAQTSYIVSGIVLTQSTNSSNMPVQCYATWPRMISTNTAATSTSFYTE